MVLAPSRSDLAAAVGLSYALRRIGSLDRLVLGSVGVLLVLLVALPVGALVYGSLRSAPPLEPGYLTIDNYISAYSDPGVLRTLANTALFSIGVTLLSVAFGTAMAWIITRTNTPGRRVFEFLTLVLYLTPSLLAVVAWTLLLSPTRGLINNLIVDVLGLDAAPFNVFSLGGMIWVQGLYLTPLAFLIVAAAFKAVDPTLEESARMSGSGVFTTFRRVTLPVARPAILSASLLIFVVGLESFEVPQLLGVRERIFTFTSLIFTALRVEQPAEYGRASALGTTLLVASLVGVYFYRRATQSSGRFVTIKGKGYRAGIVDVGRWRWVLAALCALFFTLTVFLPMAVLFVGSLLQFYGRFDASIFQRMSWSNYPTLLQHPSLIKGFMNSVLLAIASGAVCMLLAATISFVAIKTRIRGRGLLEAVAMLPLAYPATVLALGLLWSYISLPLPIYGTATILGIAYVTRYIPIGMRSVAGGMVQIDAELEEASRMAGAPLLYTFRRVVLPLLKGSLVAGWLILFMTLVRELSMSVLLASTSTPVVSVVLFDYYQSGEMGLLSAFSIVLLLAILAIVFAAQRLLRISIAF